MRLACPAAPRAARVSEMGLTTLKVRLSNPRNRRLAVEEKRGFAAARSRSTRASMKLYDYLPSGNGYKVRLLLAQLGHRFTLIEKDMTKGETRTPDFLALNPNGRIPVLELDDGRHLSESDAILFYLAEGTPFLPAERFARADVLRWMFFEQYSHEPYIAVARAWLHVLTGRQVEPA